MSGRSPCISLALWVSANVLVARAGLEHLHELQRCFLCFFLGRTGLMVMHHNKCILCRRQALAPGRLTPSLPWEGPSRWNLFQGSAPDRTRAESLTRASRRRRLMYAPLRIPWTKQKPCKNSIIYTVAHHFLLYSWNDLEVLTVWPDSALLLRLPWSDLDKVQETCTNVQVKLFNFLRC